MDIVSREDAKAKGLKRYFTGKPCKRGHLALRNVANGNCVACQAAVTEKWGRENPELKQSFYNDWIGRNPQYHAEWEEKNPDAVRIAKQKWYAKNADGEIERVLAWAKANPEKRRANVRNYTALKKSASGSHTAEEVTAMLERQNWKCVGCGVSIREKRHIDHIIPLKRGGSNDIGNLQGLCPTCNCSKNAKDPIEWARQLGRLL